MSAMDVRALDVLVPCVENDKAELAAVANAAQTSEEA